MALASATIYETFLLDVNLHEENKMNTKITCKKHRYAPQIIWWVFFFFVFLEFNCFALLTL